MATKGSSTFTLTTPSDLEIVMTRVFDAPRALVFEAFTKPEYLVRWFGRREDTLIVCEIDLRVGGTARFVWRFPDGSEMGMTDVYREIVPPDRIVFAETFDEPYLEEMGGQTLNTFLLEERDGKTTMTVTTLYTSREERDRVIATGMASGAGEAYDRLEKLLEALQQR